MSKSRIAKLLDFSRSIGLEVKQVQQNPAGSNDKFVGKDFPVGKSMTASSIRQELRELYSKTGE